MESELSSAVAANVTAALAEDIGSGDLTAGLISAGTRARARLLCRQPAIICGRPWFDTCFQTLDPTVAIDWHVEEGDAVGPDTVLCHVEGLARPMLSAERPALNFLQTLSATATATRTYANAAGSHPTLVMDTRKTLPGLRLAQKYAVRVGGGANQRIGLFDGILIKENHIAACGGIRPALEQARALAPVGVSIQIEVENLGELDEALAAGATLVLLDNFSLVELREAVARTGGRAELEASGNVSLNTIAAIAATGVQRISVGAITKHIDAVDLSLRIETC